MVSPCFTDEETEAQNEEGRGPSSQGRSTAPNGPDGEVPPLFSASRVANNTLFKIWISISLICKTEMTRATSEPADRLGRANVCLKCPVHSKASGQTGVAGVGGVGGGGRFLRRHHHQTLAWAFRPPGLKCRRLHLLAVKPRTSYLTSLGLRFAVCKVGPSQHPPHRLSRGSRH